MLSRLLINYEAQSRAFIDLISGGGPCAFFTCLFVNEQESKTGTNAAGNQPALQIELLHPCFQTLSQ